MNLRRTSKIKSVLPESCILECAELEYHSDHRIRGGNHATTLRKRNSLMTAMRGSWSRRSRVSLPMHQHSSTPIKPLLYKAIARGKVLYDVFILDVVDFNDKVFVALE